MPHENVNLLVYDNSHETVNWDTLLNLYLGYSFSYYIPNIMVWAEILSLISSSTVIGKMNGEATWVSS